MTWAISCPVWVMLAIGSLEHSKLMSENTQDEFEPQNPTDQDEEAQTLNTPPFQPDQPELTETEQSDLPPASPETTLPPEAQGEANGGPLGCCLGVMVGLLLSLSLAILSRVYAEPLANLFQNNFWLLGLLVRILMGILAFALAILCGYFGWKLGKKFYREDEPRIVKQRGKRPRSSGLSRKV